MNVARTMKGGCRFCTAARPARVLLLAGAMALPAAMAAGCQKVTLAAYQAVSLGQTPEQVRKVLGPPNYRFDGEWVWTRSDPRDLVKVTVRFGEDNTVVGKSWQNPERPWENHRLGQTP